MIQIQGTNLAFVHIPKNAGQSIRNALAQCAKLSFAAMAADLGVDETTAEHCMEMGTSNVHDLGRIQPEHMPLDFLSEYFPATWQSLIRSRSFALVRPPRDRFFSALLQRLREHRGVAALRVDDPALKAEARHVCDWLDRRGPFCDMEYIHFSRQRDYAELRKKRIVTRVFPIDRIDLAETWLKQEMGLSITVTQDHVRREPKKWAGPIQPAARFLGRRLVPSSIRERIYPYWVRSYAFADAAPRYSSISLGTDVEHFISEYYACDKALYEEALLQAKTTQNRRVA